MTASLRRLAGSPPGMLALWSLLALAVQRWPSVGDGIRVQFASDARSYEVIARAAPGLPDTNVLRPFAERFPVHWLVGELANLTSAPLDDVYRAASVLCVGSALFVLHRALLHLRLDGARHGLALGGLAASAYPLHYLLAAPGMLTDGVFVLGLCVLLLGFTSGRFAVGLAGLAVATVGRQTAVPVGVAAAIWVLLVPAWRAGRLRRAAACILLPGAIYAVVHVVADPFANAERGSLHDLTMLGFLTGIRPIADHLGRVVLGLAPPAALALGAWRRSGTRLVTGPLLVAASIAAQPLVLGPSSNGSNEPRLAGLAAPALALAAGSFLASAPVRRVEAAFVAAALALGGFHHRYTHVGLTRNVVWAAVELACALAILVVLARPGARRRE